MKERPDYVMKGIKIKIIIFFSLIILVSLESNRKKKSNQVKSIDTEVHLAKLSKIPIILLTIKKRTKTYCRVYV